MLNCVGCLNKFEDLELSWGWSGGKKRKGRETLEEKRKENGKGELKKIKGKKIERKTEKKRERKKRKKESA